MTQFSLDSPWLWYCVIINIGISVGFAIIGFLAFQRTSRPLMRLKSDVSVALKLDNVVVDMPASKPSVEMSQV